MPPEAQPKPEESAAGGVPAWMVTFSDCMTLLLCFFVLLLTFSSFDEVKLDKLGGAFRNIASESIFPHERTIKDAIVPPVEAPIDHTQEGSERPTTDRHGEINNPKRLTTLVDKTAYSDRKVIMISSETLFYGRGSSLTTEGKTNLRLVASFIRRLPCKVTIGESNHEGEVSLQRAWAILDFLTSTETLDEDLFSISAGNCAPGDRPDGEATMEIVLLARDLHR